MLNFGTVELLVNLLVLQLSRRSKTRNYVPPLAQRIATLRALSASSDLTPDQAATLATGLAAIEGVLHLRNAVAHNPLLTGWTTEEHSGPPDFMAIAQLGSLSGGRGTARLVSLSHLNQANGILHSAAAQLSSLLISYPEFSLLTPESE